MVNDRCLCLPVSERRLHDQFLYIAKALYVNDKPFIQMLKYAGIRKDFSLLLNIELTRMCTLLM